MFSEEQRLKELKAILKAARGLRMRMILNENYRRYEKDFEAFEESLLDQIDEIEFYIELEKILGDIDDSDNSNN